MTSPKGEGPGPDRTSSIQFWGYGEIGITADLHSVIPSSTLGSSTK